MKLCAEHGLGSGYDQFQIKGEKTENVITPFLPAKHNAVSWLELALRKSFFQWLIFKTPLLNFFSWGARRYYDLWDFLVGKKIRQDFFSKSGYVKQWKTK
ncbi:hypothetical protein ACFLUC_01180 [Chloroflexota bacterium]